MPAPCNRPPVSSSTALTVAPVTARTGLPPSSLPGNSTLPSPSSPPWPGAPDVGADTCSRAVPPTPVLIAPAADATVASAAVVADTDGAAWPCVARAPTDSPAPMRVGATCNRACTGTFTCTATGAGSCTATVALTRACTPPTGRALATMLCASVWLYLATSDCRSSSRASVACAAPASPRASKPPAPTMATDQGGNRQFAPLRLPCAAVSSEPTT